jgi:hypothetical protein
MVWLLLLLQFSIQACRLAGPVLLAWLIEEEPCLPELALSTHGILRPHLHAVNCGSGIMLSGQVAAHHLILMEPEVALQHDKGPV